MKIVAKCPSSTLKKKRSGKCAVNIGEATFKDQRSIANIRERQRTQNLNNAFETLKKLIPTMATDKLSKIQTLRIAKCYIQFLNGLLNEEPVEKYQHQNELKKGFKIWRMENEATCNNQVSSSTDFLIKEEFEKDDFDKYSFDKDSCDRDSDDKEFEKSLSFKSKDVYDEKEGCTEQDTYDSIIKDSYGDAYTCNDAKNICYVKDTSSTNEYDLKFTYDGLRVTYNNVKVSLSDVKLIHNNSNLPSSYEREESNLGVIKQYSTNDLQFIER